MTRFSERIDYDGLFDGLARNGVIYSETDRYELRDVITKHLNNHEGGSGMPTDIGGIFQMIVDYCVRGCQTLYSYFTGTRNADDIGNSPLDYTSNLVGLDLLAKARQSLYFELRGNPKFAGAADLITGCSASAASPRDMPESIYHQVKNSIDGVTRTQIAMGPNLNLRDQPVQFPSTDVASIGAPLPTGTRALTGAQALG